MDFLVAEYWYQETCLGRGGGQAGGVGVWKIKKEGRSIVQGQVFLKGGGWHFSYLAFLHLGILSKNEPENIHKLR